MSASVIAAVLDRLVTLTGVDAAFFDEAPMSNASGGIPEFPYVILHDDGTTPDYTEEYECVESTRLRVEVYANASNLESTVRLVKYGAGAYNAKQGMDFCHASLTVTGQSILSVVRQNEQRYLEKQRDGAGLLVYRCTISYLIQANLTA